MAYQAGNNTQIIVGAAAFFVGTGPFQEATTELNGFAVTEADDKITKTAHGLVDDQKIRISSPVITDVDLATVGIQSDIDYFVYLSTANDFVLSLTDSGDSPAQIDILLDSPTDVVVKVNATDRTNTRMPFGAGSYKDTLHDNINPSGAPWYDTFTNIGYTSNGLELMFEPDFGEVSVDQVLDVAKLFKQGMKVSMKTSFAEATLENLLVSIAAKPTDLGVAGDKLLSTGQALNLSAGTIGECPVERGIIAVGPGTGDCSPGTQIERVYEAYRALSIESVTVSAKRDEPSAFEVSFRLLPSDKGGSYGKIIDRTYV
jgi:hypothetical protein